MINQVSESTAKRDIALLSSEKADELIARLREDYKEAINKLYKGTITYKEYMQAANDFNYQTIHDFDSNEKILKFTLFALLELERKRKFEGGALRKKKGDYSIPDKVIDGVIDNIVHGEKVEDACKYAGITRVTLYNRIRARGYDSIKEFFKDKRRELRWVDSLKD